MSKDTQRLVDQFRHELLIRRKYLDERLDSLSELHYTTIELVNEEMDRIDAIFKLMENNKI